MQPEIGITVPTAADLLDIAHLAGGWPAVFSVNPKKEIWPYVTRGLTPLVDLRLVHGRVELLDQAATHLLLLRRGQLAAIFSSMSSLSESTVEKIGEDRGPRLRSVGGRLRKHIFARSS